jgi:hypothetical protein
MTAKDLVEKYDVPLGTTRTRLSNGVRDIEVLKKPPAKQNKYKNAGGKMYSTPGSYVPDKTVKQRVAKRNYFDPLSRLLLKTLP